MKQGSGGASGEGVSPEVKLHDGLLIITGASRGIGLATASLFSAKGWRVVNISRTECPLPGVHTIISDLSMPGWEVLIEDFLKSSQDGEKHRRICLIHNAAVMVRDSSLAVNADEMRQCFEVNVIAPAVLNRVVHCFMGHRSSILYIGSTLAEKGVPGSTSYVASKHALVGVMKVTCQDLGQAFASDNLLKSDEPQTSISTANEIHTACICPGFTGTEMLVAHLGSDPEFKASILGMQTMARLLDPKEVARVVAFCAENPAVNGSVVHCNLGQVER
eukprot:CAMPEP_0171676312 /NCGR_PEP_ID=MMETSP0990-20121206/54350_1 /TAXON_ID=483369 /ORGANISM="non described non described, Strain CCMP2098" /LENGTH=275 /DNA_ID=CAMNT_0012262449 /DNA_START=14 /DNA_END=841 /DNA_ORIENTATION=-